MGHELSTISIIYDMLHNFHIVSAQRYTAKYPIEYEKSDFRV